MVIRQRAVLAEDKQERHHAILDAAERLLARAPDRVANVAEVADEAGLAKGTVYLYFPGKEELLLALHERHNDTFFGALIQRLGETRAVTFAELLAITQSHIVAQPTFLPLATRCMAMMATEVPHETAEGFHARMAQRLQDAGAGLERHFRELRTGDGVVLLRRSFALVVGLWQMSWAHPHGEQTGCGLTEADFPDELALALRALWEGTIGRPLDASTHSLAQEA